MNQLISIWDEKKNIYSFVQQNEIFFVKQGNKTIFTSGLIKLKEVEAYPVRPLIVKNKLLLFNYDKGIEIHQIDGDEKVFLPIKAIQLVRFCKNKVFFQKRTSLLIFNLDSALIEKAIPVSESLIMKMLGDDLLLYLFKRGKTFLLKGASWELLELRNFPKDFGILTDIVKKGDEVIVFYSQCKSKINTEKYNGVFRYNLKTENGIFDFGFADFSANCAKYINLLHFSFCDNSTVSSQSNDYLHYLKTILDNFGFFAMLYYTDNHRLKAIDEPVGKVIIELVETYIKRMSNFPKTNVEFYELIEDMRKTEKDLLNIIL